MAYIELGEGNGGIILNMSEGGLGLQALMEVTDEKFPRMRFQLAHPKNWVEASGQVAWTGDTGKTAGMRFVDLSEETRTQILEWLFSEANPDGNSKEKPVRAEAKEPIANAPTGPARSSKIPEPVQVNVFVKERVEEAGPFSPAASVPEAGVREEIPLPANRILEVPPDFKLTRIETVALEQTGPETRASRRWALPALFSFFVIASLAAGWAAGRRNLLGVTQQTAPKTVQPNSPDRNAPPTATSANEKGFEIEVVDVNNRHWFVPTSGPVAPVRENLPPQNISVPSAPARRPKIPSLGWISRPFPAARVVTNVGAAAEDSPPALSVPGGPEQSMPLFGSENSRNANVEPLPPGSPAAQPSGNLQVGQLIHRVEPVYPPGANDAGIEGTVKLHAVIRKDGTVGNIKVVSGQPLLVPAAVSAVRQWGYKPTLLDGRPIEIEQDISIVFHLHR